MSILTSKQDEVFYCFSYPEVQPDFELSFENSPSTETLDYVLLDGFTEDLKEVIQKKQLWFLLQSVQFTVCFWMYSEDKDNYGTPFSYATKSEDNEVMRIKQDDVMMIS